MRDHHKYEPAVEHRGCGCLWRSLEIVQSVLTSVQESHRSFAFGTSEYYIAEFLDIVKFVHILVF